MKKIFISSPYRSNPQKNKKLIYKLCHQALERGYAPFAPHGFYTNFLKETEEHRKMGLDAGTEFLVVCEEVWVYNLDEISEGMRLELEYARANFIPVKYIFNSNGFLCSKFRWFKGIGEKYWRG